MLYLKSRDRRTLAEMLKSLVRPVTIEILLDELSAVPGVVELMTEVVSLAPSRLSVDVHHRGQDPQYFAVRGVQETPAVLLVNSAGDVSGVRLVGIPTGYQFGVFIEHLLDVSRGHWRQSHAAMTFLRNLDQDVRLEVLVAPTCPHSPRAVRAAHQVAMANPVRIHMQSLDLTQFPERVSQYHVTTVPLTVIQTRGRVLTLEGAGPSSLLLTTIRQAVTGRNQEEGGE